MSVMRQGSLVVGSAVLASGTTSTAVDMGSSALAGVVVPSGMASTSLTFTVSIDGTTYVPMKDRFGNSITVTISSAAAFHSLRDVLPLGVRFVKVISGSSETTKTVQLVGQQVV